MNLTKKKMLLTAAVIAALVGVFWWGGNAPGLRGGATKPAAATAPTAAISPQAAPKTEKAPRPAPSKAPASPTAIQPPASRPGGEEGGLTGAEKRALAEALAGGSSPGVSEGDAGYCAEQGMVLDQATGKDKYRTDPVPVGKPIPVEPENAVLSDKAFTCTLSVSCAAILDNMDWLEPEKVELIPKDGIIMPATTVTFYEGESVFHVLTREMKQHKIHMEFVNTPLYNSAYIEGIHNLYEFDCGELSGWMYRVNDWFPNYGCSRYQLKEGDVVEWVYTCNLGADVGGFSAVGSQ